MSDMGEMFSAMREENRIKKGQRLDWNTQIIDYKQAELSFELIKHSEHHFSLIRKDGKRLDIWPSTQKGGWFHKNKMYGKTFFINDLEHYIDQHFK